MASKLPTTETSSEGSETVTNVGPETRDAVIANTKSALQNHLGSNTTITVIAVSDDKYSQAPVSGQGPPQDDTHGTMKEANTGKYVTPDINSSYLAYYNTDMSFILLFLCHTNDSTNTRFLYKWHIQEAGVWKWYSGVPYLTDVNNLGDPVPVSKNEITRQVAENTVAAIESAFENMMPGVPFQDVRFVWKRCSGPDDRSGPDDFNFNVSKTIDGTTCYWRTQKGNNPGVPLTKKLTKGARYNFFQSR